MMTRSSALRVPPDRGEAVRLWLAEAGLLREDLRIRSDGPFLLLPIHDAREPPLGHGDLVESDFEPYGPRHAARSYQDLVECAPALRERLPRSFDVVGDIVLIRIPADLDALGPAIGAALLRFVPRARLVGQDRGVHGPERRRSLSRLAGEGEWRTVHHENGVSVWVDLERAYFSPRLAREHDEVARAVGEGEVVYDLCCGVGPFSLAIAREERAARIVAVDSNPAAIALLRESAAHAKGGGRIEAIEQDVLGFSASAPAVERAILNLPHEGIKYLPSVARLVRPGGTVHYYEVVAREALPRRPGELVDEMGGPSRWSPTAPHVVHPYSAGSDLVAFRFTARQRGGGP